MSFRVIPLSRSALASLFIRSWNWAHVISFRTFALGRISTRAVSVGYIRAFLATISIKFIGLLLIRQFVFPQAWSPFEVASVMWRQ